MCGSPLLVKRKVKPYLRWFEHKDFEGDIRTKSNKPKMNQKTSQQINDGFDYKISFFQSTKVGFYFAFNRLITAMH